MVGLDQPGQMHHGVSPREGLCQGRLGRRCANVRLVPLHAAVREHIPIGLAAGNADNVEFGPPVRAGLVEPLQESGAHMAGRSGNHNAQWFLLSEIRRLGCA